MFGRGGRPPGAIKGWLEGDPEKGWSFREVKTDPVALARQTRVMGDVTKAALAGQTIDTPEMAQEFLEKANLPTGTWDSLRRLSRIQAAGGTFGERDASTLYKLEQDVFQQAEKATKVLGPRDATGSFSRAGLQPMYAMVAQIRELATDASKQAGGGARSAVDKFTKAIEKSTRVFGDNFKTVEKFGQAIKETTPHLERIRDITGRESVTQSMRGQLAESTEMLGVMKGRIVKGLEADKALVAAARDIGGVGARREILTRGQRQEVAGAYQRARAAGPVVGDIGGRTFDARQRLAEVSKQGVGWKQLMSISYLPWQLQFSKLWGGEQSEQALAATAGVQQLQAQAQRTMGFPAEMDIPSLVRERQARTAQAEYLRGEGAAGTWAGPGGAIDEYLTQHPGAARTVGKMAPFGPALSYALIGSIVLPSIVAVGKSVVGKGAAIVGVGTVAGGATKVAAGAGLSSAARVGSRALGKVGLGLTSAGLLGGSTVAGLGAAGLVLAGGTVFSHAVAKKVYEDTEGQFGTDKPFWEAMGEAAVTGFKVSGIGAGLVAGGLQKIGISGPAERLAQTLPQWAGITGIRIGGPPGPREAGTPFGEALQRVAPDLAGQMTPQQIATAELSMARAGVRPEVMGGPAATYGLSYLKMADMGGRAHELEWELGLEEGEIGAIGRQHLIMTGESGEEVVQGVLDTADAQKAAGKDPSAFIEGYMRSFQAATMEGLRAGMDTRQIEALRREVAPPMDAWQAQKAIEGRTLATPVAWSKAMRAVGRDDLAFVDDIGRPTYFGLAQSQQKAQAEHGWAMTRMQYGASSGEVGQAGEMMQFQWGTDMLPGGGDGGAIPRQRAISDQLRDINRGYQSTQMDFNLRQGEINLERRQRGTGRGYEIQQGQWQMQWDALHRQQETFGLAERSNEIQREMFETKLGWRQEDIGKQMTRGAVQFDWQREDWAVNRNTAGLQFGWQQEDFDESIRYASGRERVQLKKKRERSVTMYNVQQGQMDRQEERGTQQYQWSREDQQESLERLNEEAVLQRELLDIGDQRLEIQKQDLADAEQKLVWRREEMEFAQSLAKDELILAGERQEFALTQKNDLVEIRGLEDDLQTIQRDGEDLGATHQKARYDAEKTFYDEFIPDAETLLDMQQAAQRAHALYLGWVTEGWKNFGIWILNNMAEGKPVYEALKSVSDLMGTISPEAMQDFEQQMADVLGDACEGEGGVPGCWR